MGLWIVVISCALALIGLGAYIVGTRLPEEHRAEASAYIPNQSPPVIAARIRDVEHSGACFIFGYSGSISST